MTSVGRTVGGRESDWHLFFSAFGMPWTLITH